MVYVGISFQCGFSKTWPYNEACHMFADTENELHVMADKLWLKRSWFQRGTVDHYDLTPSKRRRAVQLGALSLTRKAEAKFIRKHRKTDIGKDVQDGNRKIECSGNKEKHQEGSTGQVGQT